MTAAPTTLSAPPSRAVYTPFSISAAARARCWQGSPTPCASASIRRAQCWTWRGPAPGAEGAEWIAADARTLRLGRRFDLVMLTGHAFQVFLTDDDQRAALATIAAHLAPGGRFIFDSRNPAAREWEEWQPHNSRRWVDHPAHGRVEAWNSAMCDDATGIVTYGTWYRLANGRTLSAQSRIRFTPRAALEQLIAEAGLSVERWFGDWHGGPDGAQSPEFIPLGQLSPA